MTMKEKEIILLVNYKTAIGQFKVRVDSIEMENAEGQKRHEAQLRSMRNHIEALEESYEELNNFFKDDSTNEN